MGNIDIAKAIIGMNQALKISSYRHKRMQIIRDHGYFSYKKLYKRLHREKLREKNKSIEV